MATLVKCCATGASLRFIHRVHSELQSINYSHRHAYTDYIWALKLQFAYTQTDILQHTAGEQGAC